MPNNFEVGDVVRCIQGSAVLLTEGRYYTVVSLSMFSNSFIDVIGEGDSASHGGWMPSRFELASSSQHPKTKPSKLTGMTQFYKDREISYG
jgi:hypothetical protein